MASLALGLAGAAIGSLFGMPALGFALGSAIGSALFPAKGPDGPRLTDLRLQTSSYGKMIPFVFGAMRVGGNVIWTTPLEEHKHKNGGKGGPNVTTYTYTASFACLICEGPIEAVRRIWADGTLIYDTTAGAAMLPEIPMVIYKGSDVQAPDPTMESIIGVGEVPANHGYAYVVFTDWDLGSFGNRLPSLNFEVITTPVPDVMIYVVAANWPVGPWRSGYSHIGALDAYMSAVDETGVRVVGFPYGDAQIFDPTTLAQTDTVPRVSTDFFPERVVLALTAPPYTSWNCDPAGIFNGQPLYHNPDSPYFLTHQTGADGALFALGMGTPFLNSGIPSCGSDLGRLLPEGLRVMGCAQTSDQQTVYLFTATGATADPPYQWWKITGTTPTLVDSGTVDSGVGVHDAIGSITNVWGSCAASLGYGKQATFENGAPYCWRFVGQGATLFNIDDTGLFKHSTVAGFENQLFPIPNDEEFDTGMTPSPYSPQTGYCYVAFGDSIHLLSRFPPAPSVAVPLSEIVSALSVRAGLSTSDIDVTQLVDLVDGYIIEQQSNARDCITPLQSAFFFDGVESNGIVKFVKRGAAPAVVIPDNDLAAAPTNSSPPALLPWKRAQEVDLPATLSVSYVNGGASYQIGTQYARRLVTSSQLTLASSLAINMTDEKANAVAWTLLMDAWLGRESYTVSLPRKYWYLEPTDVVTAHGFTMRLTGKRDRLDGVIEFEGIQTNQQVWLQGPVAVTGTGGGTTSPPVLQPTNALLLDIPLITDLDLQCGFYAAYAGSVDTTWRGASLLKSYDLGASFTQVDAVRAANTIGTAATILAPFYGGNTFDEGNVVTVVIGNGGGDLASDNEDNLLNGTNAALLGDEIIQYKNAVLTSPNTYDLSGLLRGRRGTEWAMFTHVQNERFVALPVDDVTAPQGDIGLPLTYAAVTVGDTVVNTTKQTFENDGAAARCYSPVQVYGTVNVSNGDVTVRWTRRTRVGGAWQNLTDVPLAEASELYVVQIWNSDYTLCARVIQGIATPTTVYTGAQQVTDFGAQQQTLYVTVGQIGLFGLGKQAGATLDGNGATVDAPLNPVAPYNSAPPVAPPTGGCTGTVYNETITWAVGDSGIILQPPFFDDATKWVQKITTPGAGAFRIRIWWFEYGGVPGMRHVTLSNAPCGAPLIPAVKQDLFYPQIYAYMGAPNPFPTQFATLLPATDYYFTITVDANGSLPMAYEIQIDAL